MKWCPLCKKEYPEGVVCPKHTTMLIDPPPDRLPGEVYLVLKFSSARREGGVFSDAGIYGSRLLLTEEDLQKPEIQQQLNEMSLMDNSGTYFLAKISGEEVAYERIHVLSWHMLNFDDGFSYPEIHPEGFGDIVELPPVK